MSLGAARFPVTVGALELPTPVLVAAGCAGSGADLLKWGHPAFIGAVTSPTLRARVGEMRPQYVVQTPGGVVRVPGSGWADAERYAAEVAPALCEGGGRVIAAVAGGSSADIGHVVRTLMSSSPQPFAAVELDLCDPAADDARRRVVDSLGDVERAVRAARSELPDTVALLVRLEGEQQNLTNLAARCLDSGAAGFVVSGGITTVLPVHGCLRRGILTGPAVLGPTAARIAALHQDALDGRLPAAPLIATGGVRTARDAAALMAAGACAVGLGSVVLNDPTSPWRIAYDLPPLVRTGSRRTANAVAGHAPGGRGLAALAPPGAHAAEHTEGEA